MNSILMDVLYSTLVDVVPRTIAIFIPLVGAFWIFKVREKAVAEGKIFELGREIANLLQSKEVRGPFEGISSHYIDRAKYKLNEPNHEKALNALLKENLFNFKHVQEPSDTERKESAETIVALATERWHSLVPPTVNWSGRGVVYSLFGEKTEIGDSYFPFGTKLYRQWIGKFSDISRDLWAVSSSRRFFVESFLVGHANSAAGIDKAFVENWLDEIDLRMEKIRPIHAKLLTQIQTIDTQIDLPRLGRDIGILSFYICLLSVTGFFAPRIFYLSEMATKLALSGFALATVLVYALISIRIASAAKPLQDKNVQRKIFLPTLRSELEDMEKPCVRYRPHVIKNILSLKSELRLSSRLRSNLLKLADRIDNFNECAAGLYKRVSELIGEVGREFPTTSVNQQGFGINVADLASRDFGLEDIKSRVMVENCNFIVSEEQPRSSRTLLTINLSDLSGMKRSEFCDFLERTRVNIFESHLYEPTMAAYGELQELRRKSLAAMPETKGGGVGA